MRLDLTRSIRACQGRMVRPCRPFISVLKPSNTHETWLPRALLWAGILRAVPPQRAKNLLGRNPGCWRFRTSPTTGASMANTSGTRLFSVPWALNPGPSRLRYFLLPTSYFLLLNIRANSPMFTPFSHADGRPSQIEPTLPPPEKILWKTLAGLALTCG